MSALLHLVPAFLVYGVAMAGSAKESGPATWREFTEPTEIQGLTVLGRVEFYSNGSVAFARLAVDDSVLGQPFPAGTGIHFTVAGQTDWCFLPRNCVFQGHNCRGGGHSWMTGLYPDAKLASAGLVGTEVIDGIPCAAGTFWNEAFGDGGRTYFYESGRLRYAKVARTIEFQGHVIRKGQHVGLDRGGRLERID